MKPDLPPSSSSTFLSWFVALLLNLRGILFAIGLALLAIFWPVASQLSFDQSIESLYAKSNQHLQNYTESKSLFGGDEFVILANHDPALFSDKESLELSEAAVSRIENLVTQLRGNLEDDDLDTEEEAAPEASTTNGIPGVLPLSLQDLATTLDFRHTRKRVTSLIEGILLGEDRETSAVVMRLESEQTAAVPRAETIQRIKEVAAKQPQKTYVVGEPVQVQEMFKYVEEDGQTLFIVSLCLLGVILLLFFRSARWVVIPLVLCLFSIKGTEALLVMSNTKLSMVSSMLNSLVTIIGIATITHIAVHYRANRLTDSATDALKKTLQQLLPAIFWTSATTAVGFGALLSSQITPVQSFGMMMSLATLLVLCSVILLVPGGVLMGKRIPTESSDRQKTAAPTRLGDLLKRQATALERHPKLICLTTIGLLALAGLGATRLKIETDFSKNFRESSPIIQSLTFVESNLGGAGSWEVNFPAPKELNEKFLKRVAAVSDQLRELKVDSETYLTKVISLSDGLKAIPNIPILANTLPKRLRLLKGFQHDFVSSLYSPDQKRMRIVLRSKERQPSEKKLALILAVEQLVKQEFSEANTTGLYVLLTYLIESLLSDQLLSFSLAGLGIFLMMSLAFRSPLIGLISLVPNLFPIFMVIGFMGWFELPVNIATAMIASVSMGLTVDSSIHYLSAYQRARRNGSPHNEAIQKTHQSTGRALIYANCALILGFSVLTLSHFIPLIYFGILVSLAMLGGLAGNLFLLPLLLRWADHSANKTALSSP